MLIFREVEELVLETKSKIMLLGSEQDMTLDKRKLQNLNRLVFYINGFTYLKHREIIAKVKTFLRSRYSYEAVAEEYGISKKQAHKSISYASEQLRRNVQSTVMLIREGHLDGAQRELDILTGVVDASSLFIGGITEEFPPRKNTGVVLGDDCRRELSFLSALSRKKFESIASTLDDRRLEHILYILLSSDKTYLREKELVWNCVVDGRLTVDQCIRSLNDEYIYSPLSDGYVSDTYD